MVAWQAEQVAELRAEVAELRRQLGQNSRNSSKSPSSDWPYAAGNCLGPQRILATPRYFASQPYTVLRCNPVSAPHPPDAHRPAPAPPPASAAPQACGDQACGRRYRAWCDLARPHPRVDLLTNSLVTSSPGSNGTAWTSSLAHRSRCPGPLKRRPSALTCARPACGQYLEMSLLPGPPGTAARTS